MTNFSEMIKKYREENNLTQQEFADSLHVSRQAVSKWETGNSYPNYDILKEIAILLNTTVDNLLSKEEIVKETINVKNKNKRNLIMIISSVIIALIAIIIGITAIVVSNSKQDKEVIPEEIEEPNIKYLGFFMRIEEFSESAPTVEDYNKEVYPGIYIVERNGKYDAISRNHTATTIGQTEYVHTDTEYRITYKDEFAYNLKNDIRSEKFLTCYYSYVNLDTNEIYFEQTKRLREKLNGNVSWEKFEERNVFKEIKYVYDITLYFYEDVKETKVIEYDNEFNKIKETIVDYAYFDNSDKTYYTYEVSDECLYVIVEDEYDNKIEKRMIWREEMNKSILLYHSEDEMFTNFIAFVK